MAWERQIQRTRAAARRIRRSRLPLEEVWEQALPTELAFWRKTLSTGGLHWPWAFERGLDPAGPVIDPLLIERIDALDVSEVDILDVGAGPLSNVGRRHPGKLLRVTPTDPLADEYDELLAELELEPPVRTIACRGEDLLDHFGPDRFHLAYARNSLDHSADPLAVLRNMVAVVRPGGHIVLRHYQNEGEIERYEELHQWNFDVRNGSLVLWNRRHTMVPVGACARSHGSVDGLVK